MKVSVIVAAYNIEKYIEKCLKSIINQTLEDIEIIVVNDGSTDNTLECIKKMAKNEKRIILIDKKNEGPIEARKSGLEIARGEYILFVDGDDWLEDETLKLLYKKGISKEYDIVIYNAFRSYDSSREDLIICKDKENLQQDPLKSLLTGKMVPSIWSKFVRNDFLKKNKISFPNNISFAEDLATVAKFFMYEPKIGIVEECLYNYYQRDDSITKKVSIKILEVDKALRFIEKLLNERKKYGVYKKEFEYTVFMHLFVSRILATDKLEKIHKEVYKQYKHRKVDIYNNCYIKEFMKKNPLSLRIRVRLYNRSYYLGMTYDLGRKIAKKVLVKKE